MITVNISTFDNFLNSDLDRDADRDKPIDAEKMEDRLLENRLKQHKCVRCVWGRRLGNKFVCLFYRCVKVQGWESDRVDKQVQSHMDHNGRRKLR